MSACVRQLSYLPQARRKVEGHMAFLVALRPYLSFVHSFVFRGTPALLTVSLCLGIIGEIRTALADPMTSLFFQMQGTVCAPQCGAPLNVTFNPSTNNGPTSDPIEVLLGGASNNASVSGFADFGHLGVLAEADTQAMNTGASGLMLAQAAASFTEPFAVTSSTLAPGTIVKAMAVVGMDGIAQVSGGTLSPEPGQAVTSAQWNFFVSMQDLSNPTNFVTICQDSLVACDPPGGLLGPNVPFEVTNPFVFTFVVGETPIIEGQLLAGATAGSAAFGDGAFASQSVTSFAFHTANFYLQPLDDFTLVSSSGHDYSLPASTSVPEPNSVLLFAGWLSALLIVRRRRGSRR